MQLGSGEGVGSSGVKGGGRGVRPWEEEEEGEDQEMVGLLAAATRGWERCGNNGGERWLGGGEGGHEDRGSLDLPAAWV